MNIRESVIIICSVLSLSACHSAGSEAKLVLDDDWRVWSSADTTMVYDASVPSTLMGVLCRNGVFPEDLLEGENYAHVDKTLFDVPWWYARNFSMPDLAADEHVFLVFEGLDYGADVWLNGTKIASQDTLKGPFRQFRLEISDAVARENELRVKLRKAEAGEPNIGFVDWNPRPADESVGLFRPVYVTVSSHVKLWDPWVRSKIDEEGHASLTLTVAAENLSKSPLDGRLVLRFEGKTGFVPVQDLTPGERRLIEVTPTDFSGFRIDEPRLWWCSGLGDPNMYGLDAAFEIGGKISDETHVEFGIREIEDYFTAEGHRGFRLNGCDVLIRGAGWTDELFLRNDAVDYETQIRYVKDMNLNAIRCENFWGTSSALYDLCDKYGILVLAGWSCQWEWESYLGSPCDDYGGIMTREQMDIVAASLEDQVLWLRNHPSIIAWYVGSDFLPRPELERRYAEILSRIDDRPYIASAKGLVSKVSGPSGMKMAGPYEYVTPDYWYSERAAGGAFGFNTETGIGAQMPVKESVWRTIGRTGGPIDGDWDRHCTTAFDGMHSLDVLKDAVARRFGKDEDDAEAFVRKAEFINFEGTRAMFEAFRAKVPGATGIIQWMLNSAWPSLYWQMYDYWLVPTSAYYSVRKGNAPQQLVYDYVRKTIVAVNDTRQPQQLEAKMSLYGLDGTLLAAGEQSFLSEPRKPLDIFSVPGFDGEMAILFLSLEAEGGRTTATNAYYLSAKEDKPAWDRENWMQTPAEAMADFSALDRMPEISLELDVEKRDSLMTVTLKNPSPAVACFIRLSLKNEDGYPVVPVFWEDNYVSIPPESESRIDCCVAGDLLCSGRLRLSVSGWNVPEKEYGL